MKLALIGAPNVRPIIEGLGLGYHLVLAQYMTDPAYKALYREMSARGHFIMMDNGAAELGASISFGDVLDAANVCDADEIIMPDVLDNMEETLRHTVEALKHVTSKYRVMVPQGKNWSEWRECAEVMCRWGCTTIAIAKRYEAFEGGRRRALQILYDLGLHRNHYIHLLGCYSNPLKEIADNMSRFVRGIDTAAPFAHAQHGKPMEYAEHLSYGWGEPMNRELAIQNASRLLDACAGDA